VTSAEIEDWQERFLSGAENSLRTRPREDEALREEEVRRLKQKVGELVLDNDILKEAVKRATPLAQRTSEES
jgi:hypothetical protein